MAKLYYFILLFLTTSIINAQITLTSATNAPQVGDTYNYIKTTNYSFNVSQSGANQIWDFSSVTGSTEVISFTNLASSSEPTTFPLSNIVSTSTNPNGETYYSSSNSELLIEGFFSPGLLREIYTDKREYIKYPITYNDVFNETFSGTSENIAAGQTYDRTGTTQISADGYGTLILPYTTVNNVLRVKITNTYSDTFMGFPIGPYNDVILVWFNATNNTFIASTSDAYFNGSLISSQASYLDQSDLVLATNDSNFVDKQLTIYPNPAKNYTIIKNTSFDTISLNIYDIKGVFIKTETIQNGRNQIDLSILKPGIYLIKYLKKSNLYTKKLVIK
ncbi:T9SS type A sorting domain-containing protein [Yeosuana marina]|uniref:T9SS type A sorting domain-containing protein n=1 Tax=Yeosuana marina TaxID=1565536 RepID=UPI0030C8833C